MNTEEHSPGAGPAGIIANTNDGAVVGKKVQNPHICVTGILNNYERIRGWGFTASGARRTTIGDLD